MNQFNYNDGFWSNTLEAFHFNGFNYFVRIVEVSKGVDRRIKLEYYKGITKMDKSPVTGEEVKVYPDLISIDEQECWNAWIDAHNTDIMDTAL